MSKEPDRIFAQPLAQVPDFAFNEDVVRVFPDMIKRSVPGYPTIVENLGVLAAQFAQPNSVLYDLGSSLGAVTQALRRLYPLFNKLKISQAALDKAMGR